MTAHAEIIPSVVDRIKRSLVGLKMPRAIEILDATLGGEGCLGSVVRGACRSGRAAIRGAASSAICTKGFKPPFDCQAIFFIPPANPLIDDEKVLGTCQLDAYFLGNCA
jgi:hypothetical protein